MLTEVKNPDGKKDEDKDKDDGSSGAAGVAGLFSGQYSQPN